MERPACRLMTSAPKLGGFRHEPAGHAEIERMGFFCVDSPGRFGDILTAESRCGMVRQINPDEHEGSIPR